jgi:Holliday junction resolvase RusA-like endonuclease
VSVSFVIPGIPVGKPRQTRRDKWAKRPAVLKYREWADVARLVAPRDLTGIPLDLEVRAFLPIPTRFSRAERKFLVGRPHRSRPDIDNILKSVMDALWGEDSGIARVTASKFYDDGHGPRVEVIVSSSLEITEVAA